MSRRELLLGAAAAAVTARVWGRDAIVDDGDGGDSPARTSLQKAVNWLWSQQADDGGWHSPQYGLMRSGQSLTPFVLHAQLGTIDVMSSDDAGRVVRAARFLTSRLDGDGVLGRFDPELTEYPVYSTSYALQCFRRTQSYRRMLGPEGDRAIDGMRRYLAAAQFDEADGFAPGDPAYGGWGFQAALAPGQSGHMDLAHTRRALEALDIPHPPDADMHSRKERAQSFLRIVQKLPPAAARPHLPLPADGPARSAPPPLPFDGGFYFSPVVLDANKSGVEAEPTPHWRSYATATCDGALALLAAGVPHDDERVTAAVAWLQRHADVDYPLGVPRDDPEPWGAAIRFYHYAVRAEAYRKLNFPAAEQARLAAAVVRRQRPNGSFVNDESPLMKEDDPVLCTALAVVALANCLA